MSFSFIHIADIHLGRSFSDLSILTDKTEMCADACKKAFDKIVELAISKKVDFVLIAGDSFDDDEHDLGTKIVFIKNLKRLADNGIKSYVICGNHDSIELYKKYQSYFKFDEKYDGIINITGVTTEDNVQIYSPLESVCIHSLSFKTDELDNPVNYLKCGDDKDFNIGLIHCDLDKTDSKYSPVSREDLRNLGYDYYALGHIHIPEIKENNMVYAGSPQGRTKKETGAHGCYYVCVNDKNNIEKEFIPVDAVRFETLDIDCSEQENRLACFEKILNEIENIKSDVELSLYDVTLSGITNAYEDLNESDNLTLDYIENIGQNEPKNKCVYRIENDTIPAVDEKEILENNGVVGIIANSFGENSQVDVDKIYEEISEIHEKIYKRIGLDISSKEFLAKALEDDKQEILSNVKREIMALCKEVYNMES